MREKNFKADERREKLKFVLSVLQGNKTKAIDLLKKSNPQLELFIQGLTDEDLIRLSQLEDGEIFEGFTPVKGFEHFTKFIV